MNLINEKVTHTTFGKGQIIDLQDKIVYIDFSGDVKRFLYPDSFQDFLSLNDPETKKQFEKVFQRKQKEQEKLEKQLEKEREREALIQERKAMLRNNKIHESSQIAFWLSPEEKETVFNEWIVSTGTIKSGQNKGEPNRAARLRPNSVAILTLRNKDEEEENRKIIGMYLLDENFLGSEDEDGLVPAHEQFRLQFTEEQADKMLFWNYYINHNYPDRMTWNSGRYRYFENIWTAQMLQDLLEIEPDEERKEKIQSFLTHFCTLNLLDPETIPPKEGALQRD